MDVADELKEIMVFSVHFNSVSLFPARNVNARGGDDGCASCGRICG